MSAVTGTNNKYALLSPNSRMSISKQVFDMLGVFEYEELCIQNRDAIRDVLANKAYQGFLIAEPFKEAAAECVDVLSDTAKLVGSVTTVKRLADGSLKGYNTDVESFKFLIPDEIKGWKAVILGTGSAARAAAEGLKELGADPVILVSRHAEATTLDFRRKYNVLSYNDLRDHKDARIMINATPIGMYPNNCVSPLDGKMIKASAFRKLELAIDLIHNPSRTKFLQDAERCSGKDNKLVIQSLLGNIGERLHGHRHTDLYKALRDNLNMPNRVYTHSGMDLVVRQIVLSKAIWFDENPQEIKTDYIEAIKRKLLEDQLNVVLIGMPGSGKSSIARMMAKETGREFIDVDRETEALMGERMQDVLVDETKGEAYMRDFETRALREACSRTGCVIATGGGSILRPVNRDIIRENACVVYIRRPLAQLSMKNRPLSQKEGVDKLYKERAGIYYRLADVVITNSHTFGESVDRNGAKNSYTYDLKRFAYKVIRASYAKLDDMIAMHTYRYEAADKKRKKK